MPMLVVKVVVTVSVFVDDSFVRVGVRVFLPEKKPYP
jgi:hypothetical protein